MATTDVVKTQSCATCNGVQSPDQTSNASSSFIYALGQIEARFPRISLEKEFLQATARTDTKGQTDRQAFHSVLTQRENRYLARQLCWVLTIQGLETYFLRPSDPADWDLLVQSIEPLSSRWINTVVGSRGILASPDQCNGLILPIVDFDQIYTFDRSSIIKAIPKPEKMASEQFEPAAEELFDRIIQMTDNAGSDDQHRALNYLAMRYPAIYARAAESFANDYSLTAINVNSSVLSMTRKLVEVVFCFTHRGTDFTEKFFTRVDVTEQFPFLVTKLSPYYDH